VQFDQFTFDLERTHWLFTFALGIPLGLGFFWIIHDPMAQGWHDKIAGTKVVKIPVGKPVF
jgi:uncharacterized RDD family membrane protein YckC